MSQKNTKSIFFTVLALAMLAFANAGCTAKAKREIYLKRATNYFELGDYDKARIEYLNLLRIDPQNSTAIQQLGNIWFDNGVPLEAIRYLSLVPVLTPGDLSSRRKLASAYLIVGHPAEARKEAMAILDQSAADDDTIQILAESAITPDEIAETQERLDGMAQPDRASIHLALATLHLRKRELTAVEPEIQKALALDPKSALAHMAMGNLWWSKGDLSQADKEFKTAAALVGPRHVARFKYADFKAKTKAVDEAKDLLKVMVDKTPDYVAAWITLAQLAFAEKKYDEALDFLKNVLMRNSNNVDARILQANIWLVRGDAELAEKGLVALNAEQPNLPPIKLQLGRAYLQNNKVSQAAVVLQEAIARSPDFLEAQLLLASIQLRQRDAWSVAQSMEALLKKRPTLLQPQLLLVDAYRSLARLDEAEAIVRQQIAANPEQAQFHFLLGTVLLQKKQTEEAVAAFEKAFALAPDNMSFFAALVDIDIAGKRFPVALERVQSEMKKHPESAVLQFLEGKIYFAQGALDRAETSLVQALKMDPDLVGAPTLLNTVYLAEKKLTDARSLLERVLAKNPNEVGALMTAALVYEELSEFEKARDTYEKVLKVSPDNQPVMNNLAYLYSEKLNDLDRALELARKARNLQPGDAGAADTLGWILFKRAKYPQALALIKEGVSKLGENPEVQYHLGMASYMMGDQEAARTALEKAAAATANFPGKSSISKQLAVLSNGGEPSPDAAIEPLEAFAKQNPQDPLVRIQLGAAYERRGDFLKAAAAYEQAFNLNAALLEPSLKLARLYAGPLKNNQKALDFAKKARALAPNDAVVAGTLGSLAFQAGNHSWAYSILQESARQRPDDIAILGDFAWAAYSLGRVDEARQAMERLLTVAPESQQSKDAKTFLAMTEIAPDTKSPTARTPEVEQVLKEDRGYIPALVALAALQVQRGEPKAAAELYAEILRRFPDFSPAQKRLALLYLDDPQERPKARDLANKARQTLGDDPELIQILAEVSFDRQEYAYAAQLLQSNALKGPLSARSLFYLGMSHAALKNDLKAQEFLNEALGAGLKEPFATKARQTAAQLKNK